MTLLPLLGFYGFTQRNPLLPSWYHDYYTQEDRLKQFALISQRQTEWTELALEKVNEIVSVLNDTGAVDVSNLINQIEAIETELGTVNSTVDQLIADLSTANNKITENEGDINTNSTNISNLTTRVNDVEASITGINGQISTLTADINAVEGTVSSHSTRITNAETSITGINGNISTLTTDLNNLQDDIDSINLTTINDSIATLQGDVSGHDTDITALQGEVSGHTTDITTLQGEVSGLDNRVIDLENSSGGGGGTGVDYGDAYVVRNVNVDADYIYNGVNMRVENSMLSEDIMEAQSTNNYLTFGSFGGTIDIELQEDPEGRGGYRVNLEAVSSGGGGGGGSSTEIMTSFGTLFYGGEYAPLKDDGSLVFVESYSTEDQFDTYPMVEGLFEATDSKNVYVYDDFMDWGYTQDEINSNFPSSFAADGRYIPVILGDVPQDTKVYWDGEKDGSNRVYKAVISMQAGMIVDQGTILVSTGGHLTGLGGHKVIDLNFKNVRTDLPSVYSNSAITCTITQETLPNDLEVQIINPAANQDTAMMIEGTCIVSFIKD